MYVRVCICVCLYVCLYVCVRSCAYGCVCVCAYMHLCRVHTCTHGCVLYAYYTCMTVYMWHMMTTSLDHVVQQMRAVQGLKAARWQRQAHPSGACTLCSRVGSRTHAENASRAAPHLGAKRRLLVSRQSGHPEAPPYHLAHPAPLRRQW